MTPLFAALAPSLHTATPCGPSAIRLWPLQRRPERLDHLPECRRGRPGSWRDTEDGFGAPGLRCTASAGVIGLARQNQLPRLVVSEFRKRDAVRRFQTESIRRLCRNYQSDDEDGCRRDDHCRDVWVFHLTTSPS